MEDSERELASRSCQLLFWAGPGHTPTPPRTLLASETDASTAILYV